MDYNTIDRTFSIDGGRQKCYNFITRNDNIPEFTETVAVIVSTLNTLGQMLERRFVFVTILDDDGKEVFNRILKCVQCLHCSSILWNTTASGKWRDSILYQ